MPDDNADGRPRPGTRGTPSEGRGTSPPAERPDDGLEVRFLHPFQALKAYRCPGCDQEIAPGIGHVVVVPRLAPEDRRHWHRPCWDHRRTRRPKRRRG